MLGHAVKSLLGMLVAALLLAGCAGGGALSSSERTALVREARLDLVTRFGGIYENRAVQAYVEDVGRRVAQAAEPSGRYTFTVLDSDSPNAMALPSGDVYVTRGLLVLANSEAELAAAVAHEIGHVVARHADQRLARALAGEEVEAWSHDQEYEADIAGIHTLVKAGYDPRGMVSFLRSLRRHAGLQAQLSGFNPEIADRLDLVTSHPRTSDRVERAMVAAGAAPAGYVGRARHMGVINGLPYADDAEQGVVRGNTYLHPGFRFRFSVPAGFQLFDLDDSVLALHGSGALIVFTGGAVDPGQSLESIAEEWAGEKLRVERVTVNGMPAALARVQAFTRNGPMEVRLALVEYGRGIVYRFIFAAQGRTAEALDREFLQTARSFRRLTPAEAAAVGARHVETVRVPPGTRVEQLAGRSDKPLNEERLRVLNGVDAGEVLPEGLAKVLTD